VADELVGPHRGRPSATAQRPLAPPSLLRIPDRGRRWPAAASPPSRER